MVPISAKAQEAEGANATRPSSTFFLNRASDWSASTLPPTHAPTHPPSQLPGLRFLRPVLCMQD
jgi:hypothetical protein